MAEDLGVFDVHVTPDERAFRRVAEENGRALGRAASKEQTGARGHAVAAAAGAAGGRPGSGGGARAAAGGAIAGGAARSLVPARVAGLLARLGPILTNPAVLAGAAGIGALALGVRAVTSSLGRLDRATQETTDRLRALTPIITQAQAQARVAQINRDIQAGRQLGPLAARNVLSQSRIAGNLAPARNLKGQLQLATRAVFNDIAESFSRQVVLPTSLLVQAQLTRLSRDVRRGSGTDISNTLDRIEGTLTAFNPVLGTVARVARAILIRFGIDDATAANSFMTDTLELAARGSGLRFNHRTGRFGNDPGFDPLRP